ncbi:MAG: SPASM domain-containing protein [Bacteroidota bacterium]
MIFGRFIKEIIDFDPSFYQKFYKKMDRKRETDVIILIPYWLSDAMGSHLPLNTIRPLALGNKFMTAYILGQDRIMDNQNHLIQEEDIATVMLASNLLYYKWVKEYQRIFPAHSRFWLFFEKYLTEYSRSTLWEKQKHWGKLEDFSEADLKYLGQKFSPVKISCAGICLLNNRKEWIPLLSELLEQYHIGFQLADDVDDWREDLRNENYTYVLTKIHLAASATALSEQEIIDHPVARSIGKEVLEKSTFYYLKAKDIAKQLPCQKLCTILDTLIEKNEKTLTDLKISTPRSIDLSELPINGKKLVDLEASPHGSTDLSESQLDNDITLRKNDVHCFKNNGSHFVFDVNRRLVFSIDKPAYEMLQLIDSTNGATLRSISQSMTTPPNDASSIIKEFMHVGIIRVVNQDTELIPKTKKYQSPSVQKKYENIVGLDLQISTRSPNQKLMTIEVAKNAIDLLFHRSGQYKGEHIVFLSCAALESDEVSVIQEIFKYSKQMETRLFKTIRFVLNVPLMYTRVDLLSQCLASELFSSFNFSANCEDVLSFLKRSDIQQVNNLIKGSKKNIYLSLVSHSNSKEAQEITVALTALGFEKILLQSFEEHTIEGEANLIDNSFCQYEGNCHFYSSNSLRTISRVVKQNLFFFHCNAGRSFLSVATDGTIFPCPRFTGHPQYSLGTVFTDLGANQTRYLDLEVRNKETCSNCWARFICGGGCMFHSQLVTGSLNTPDVQWCTQYKEQIERSISKYYSLPPERRKKLFEGMNFSVQFCDYLY